MSIPATLQPPILSKRMDKTRFTRTSHIASLSVRCASGTREVTAGAPLTSTSGIADIWSSLSTCTESVSLSPLTGCVTPSGSRLLITWYPFPDLSTVSYKKNICMLSLIKCVSVVGNYLEHMNLNLSSKLEPPPQDDEVDDSFSNQWHLNTLGISKI